MSPPGDLLSNRALNRALLARQLLLERSDRAVADTVEHLVGLQAQVPITPYIGLWSRLRGFDPLTLSTLLERRWAVRATAMRATLHLLSARDLVGLRTMSAGVLGRTFGSTAFRKDIDGLDLDEILAAGHELIAERARTRAEIARLLGPRWPGRNASSIGQAVTYHLLLVQTTPRGLWGATSAATWALADDWLAGTDRSAHAPYPPEEIVRRYLAAFGPATPADVRAWSGMTGARAIVEAMRPELAVFRSETGRELFDLPDAPRPDPATPAPPRFLPEYDNVVLSHADRSRIVDIGTVVPWPEGRAGIVGSFLVDGFFAGMWRLTRAGATVTVRVEPHRDLSRVESAAVAAEAESLGAFLAPEADQREVQIRRSDPSPTTVAG